MTRRAVFSILAAALLSSTMLACGDDGGETVDQALFPADYAATYQQVRNCRNSLDHDLHRIRVLASPEAMAAYTGRTAPFPTGAIVLKEEYESSDTTCAGPVVQWTVMQKLPAGSAPTSLDWTWQEIDADRQMTDKDIKRCVGCHSDCGKAPEGYDGTCTVP
jgi:hypothetical protein